MTQDKADCLGGCKKAFNWDPNEVWYVHLYIDGGRNKVNEQIDSSYSTGYDHCYLVKALGAIVSTGDETTGCNGN